MGSLHGNEPIGGMILDVLKQILPTQKIHGEIYLILGNPKAYEKNKRFIDCDLNRIFDLNFKKPYNIEQQRALKIAPILKKADYLLDLHSTQKPSIPFVYCKSSPEHFELAEIFQTKYIVTANKKFKNKLKTVSADSFVDKHGGIGITFETGWNEDILNFPEVFRKTKEFLSHLKVAFQDTKPQSSKSTILEVQEHLIPHLPEFKFSKNYQNFDCVRKGESIAKEGNKCITKAYNCYIVFPKKDIVINKPVAYLAKKL